MVLKEHHALWKVCTTQNHCLFSWSKKYGNAPNWIMPNHGDKIFLYSFFFPKKNQDDMHVYSCVLWANLINVNNMWVFWDREAHWFMLVCTVVCYEPAGSHTQTLFLWGLHFHQPQRSHRAVPQLMLLSSRQASLMDGDTLSWWDSWQDLRVSRNTRMLSQPSGGNQLLFVECLSLEVAWRSCLSWQMADEVGWGPRYHDDVARC